jgi:hypothetical protein
MEEHLKMNACLHCGKPISKMPDEGKKTFGILVVLGLVAASLLIFLWNYLVQENPKDTIQEQWRAITAHHLTEAYYAYTSSYFQDATSLEEFKELVNYIPHPLKSNPLELFEVEDQHPFKAIEGVIQGVDPADLKIYYEMLFQDGIWKVNTMLLLGEE